MEKKLALILIGLVLLLVILVLARRSQRRSARQDGSMVDAGPYWFGDSDGNRHDDVGHGWSGDGGFDGGGGDGGGGGGD